MPSCIKRLLIVAFIVVPNFGIQSVFCQENLPYVDSLKNIIESTDSYSDKIVNHLKLSSYYSSIDLSKALENATKSLDLAIQNKDKKQIARSKVEVGSMLFYLGAYDKVMEFFFESLKYYEEQQDHLVLFRVYTNIGALFDRVNDLDNAIIYFNKALEEGNKVTNEKDKVSNDIPILYNNMASVYDLKKDENRAIQYFEKGLELAIKNNDLSSQGVIYNNLGKFYQKKRDYLRGEQYLYKSLFCREKIKDFAGIAKSYYFLSSFYLENGNLAKAEEMALKSEKISIELGSVETQRNTSECLSEVYERMGDLTKGLSYHKKFKQFNDSLINQQKVKQLTKVQLEYEFEKETKAREVEKERLKFRYIIVTIVMALGLIILALLLGIVRISQKKIRLQKEKLESDVEIKNKELATSVLYLVRKNELINNVAKRLVAIKDKALPENQRLVENIAVELQTEIDNDIWQEFEVRFQQVHNDFYTKLRKQFPSLTPNEERLCAFLKLNMTTKEISSITHQNFKSLEVARARLRKKLDLTNKDVDLVVFLNSL